MESTAQDDDDDLPASRLSAPRELMILAASLLFGIFLAPLLIWAAGRMSARRATHTAAPSHSWRITSGVSRATARRFSWAVALGPYVMVLLLRFLALQLRPRS